MSTNDNEMRRVLAVSRRVMRGFSPSSLVAARRTAGLSRAELARRAGVGETTIRRWEQSTSSPQVDLLATVVAELGVEIADIVRVPEADRYPGDWRVLKGLTQPQLGMQAGLRTPIVGGIERGEIPLSDVVAEKLAPVLGVSVDELLAAHMRVRHRGPEAPA